MTKKETEISELISLFNESLNQASSVIDQLDVGFPKTADTKDSKKAKLKNTIETLKQIQSALVETVRGNVNLIKLLETLPEM